MTHYESPAARRWANAVAALIVLTGSIAAGWDILFVGSRSGRDVLAEVSSGAAPCGARSASGSCARREPRAKAPV
jgi:hypothetical protein